MRLSTLALALALTACSNSSDDPTTDDDPVVDDDTGGTPEECQTWDVVVRNAFTPQLVSYPGGEFIVVWDIDRPSMMRIDAEGAVVWDKKVASGATLVARPAVTASGAVVVGVRAAAQAFVQERTADGETGWTFAIDNVVGGSTVTVTTAGDRIVAAAPIDSADFEGVRVFELDGQGTLQNEWSVEAPGAAYTHLAANDQGFWLSVSNPDNDTIPLYYSTYDGQPTAVDSRSSVTNLVATPDGKTLVTSWTSDINGGHVDTLDTTGTVETLVTVDGDGATIFGTAVAADGTWMAIGQVRQSTVDFTFGDGQFLRLTPSVDTGYQGSPIWGITRSPDGTVSEVILPRIDAVTGAFRAAFGAEGQPVVSGFFAETLDLPSGYQNDGPAGYVLETCAEPVDLEAAE